MVLFILPIFSGGGAERVTLNLLTELYYRGRSVGIIVFDQRGPLLSMVPSGVPIYNLETGTLIHSVVPLIIKLRQLQPKVVFSTFGYINIALLAIRWMLQSNISIWIREANLPSISLRNNSHPYLMRAAYYWLYRRANRVFCTSYRMRNEFISDFNVPLSKINLLSNPVDEKTIRLCATPIKYNQGTSANFVAAGRLTEQKGFDRLLQWFASLMDKNSTLTILGEGELLNDLTDMAYILGIDKQVVFTGFCDNPWQWYAGADVFLMSSRWEGMSNAVLEAMACGTPIIATADSGGISEVISESLDGGIIVVDDEKKFMDEMKKVTENSLNSLNSLKKI